MSDEITRLIYQTFGSEAAIRDQLRIGEAAAVAAGRVELLQNRLRGGFVGSAVGAGSIRGEAEALSLYANRVSALERSQAGYNRLRPAETFERTSRGLALADRSGGRLVNTMFAVSAATQAARGNLTGLAFQAERLDQRGVTSGGGLGAGGLVLGGAVIGTAAIGIAGEQSYVRATRAVRNYADTQDEANERIRELQQLSRSTFTVFDELTQRYLRLAIAGEAVGASNAQVQGVLETISIAERLQGGADAGTRAASRQLIQGIASDRLGGDELRSVREGLPELAQAIADGLSELRGEDIGVGQLRELGRNGELNASTVIQALNTQLDSLSEAAANLPPTLPEQVRLLGTSFSQLSIEVGLVLGLSDDLGGVIGSVAGGLLKVATAIQVLREQTEFFDNISGLRQDAVDVLSATFAGVIAGEDASLSEVLDLQSRLSDVDTGRGLFLDAQGEATSDLAAFYQALFEAVDAQINSLDQRRAGLRRLARGGLDDASVNIGPSAPFAEEFATRQLRTDLISNGFSQFDIRFAQQQRAFGTRLEQSGLSPGSEAYDELLIENARLSRNENQAQFNRQLEDSLSLQQRELDLSRELTGLSEVEQAGQVALFQAREEASRNGLILLDEQEERIVAQAEAQQKFNDAQELNNQIVQAGGRFVRDLITDFDDAGQAALNFLATLLEIAAVEFISSSISGSFASSGAVIDGGSVTPFASGGVLVDRPITVPLARGGAVRIGESGTEVVTPVTRGRDGILAPSGVAAQAPAMQTVVVMSESELSRAAASGRLDRAIGKRASTPGSEINRATRRNRRPRR